MGDNSTLTALVQAVVSEIVGRLTVALAVPILRAIDIEKQPALRSAAPMSRGGARHADLINKADDEDVK